MRRGFNVEERRQAGRPVYEVSLSVGVPKAQKVPLLEACHAKGVRACSDHPGSPLKLAVFVGRNDPGSLSGNSKNRRRLETENVQRVEMAKNRITDALREAKLDPLTENLQ